MGFGKVENELIEGIINQRKLLTYQNIPAESLNIRLLVPWWNRTNFPKNVHPKIPNQPKHLPQRWRCQSPFYHHFRRGLARNPQQKQPYRQSRWCLWIRLSQSKSTSSNWNCYELQLVSLHGHFKRRFYQLFREH